MFKKRYADVFAGDRAWRKIKTVTGLTYQWDAASTYVQHPPYFAGLASEAGSIGNVSGARLLGLFGDSITTDHISPAGSIKKERPGRQLSHRPRRRRRRFQFLRRAARQSRGDDARHLRQHPPEERDGAGTEGGVTRHMPDGTQMSIYDAAIKYQAEGVPLVIVAGKEYGTGSSRDWAAKGTLLLG